MNFQYVHITNCPICEYSDFSYFLTCRDYFASNDNFNIYKCINCGFAFTQDFPSESEISKYYDSPLYVPHSNANKGVINSLYHLVRKVSLNLKSNLIKKYTNSKHKTLLDIGSGTGFFLNYMNKKGWSGIGIEKSDLARNYSIQQFGIDCYDSEYLYSMDSNSRDVITMWHVLEHLEPLNDVMNYLYKILTKEGLLLVALPNKDSFDAQSYKQKWAAYDVPRHLWHFSPSDFKYLAEKHNFDIIATKPMYFDVFYISMLSEKHNNTFLASFVGLMKGSYFFFKSLFVKEKCSSLIYILKKK